MSCSVVQTSPNPNLTIVNLFKVVQPQFHLTCVNLTEVWFLVLDYLEKTGWNRTSAALGTIV
jgi:hypothetical protein